MSERAEAKEQLELEVLKIELEIKQKELSDKESWWKSINPTLGAALIAALIAFFGNIFVECSRHKASLGLENKKRETSLIIEAAKPGDPAIFRNRAKFYIDVGLIEDENIVKYIQEKDKDVFLPLFKFGPSTLIIYYLLDSLSANRDLKEYRLKIREGITSKSGLEIDARMMTRIIEKYSYLIDNFTSVEVIDKLTFKINLSEPNINFYSQMLMIAMIAKEDLVIKGGD